MKFTCLHNEEVDDCVCMTIVDWFVVANCEAVVDRVDIIALTVVTCDKTVVVGASVVVVVVVILCAVVFVVVRVVVVGVVVWTGVVGVLDGSVVVVVVVVLNVVGGINVDVRKLRSPVQLRVRTAVESSTIIINMIYNLKTFSKKKCNWYY